MKKDFRTAWLLLLIRGGPSYGYDLRKELGRRAQAIEPAVMYRSLRGMERDGLIVSRWVRSEAGPARRVYHITEAGHAELGRIATAVAVAREAHDALLAALDEPGLTRG